MKESCITAAEASKSAPQPPQKSVSPVKATGVMLGSAREATSKMGEPRVRVRARARVRVRVRVRVGGRGS